MAGGQGWSCAACDGDVATGSRFCASCGAPQQPDGAGELRDQAERGRRERKAEKARAEARAERERLDRIQRERERRKGPAAPPPPPPKAVPARAPAPGPAGEKRRTDGSPVRSRRRSTPTTCPAADCGQPVRGGLGFCTTCGRKLA